MVVPTQIVNAGIDTVKVNVKLLGSDGKPAKVQEIPEHLAALFEVWQEKARENGKPLATSMTFNNARMTVLPNGAQAWKYIIKNDSIQLSIAPRLNVAMIAKVTLSSSYLWASGSVNDAVDEVHAFLLDVFGEHIMLQAAQIDLCVDVVGLVLPTEWEEVFVTHALGKSPITESQKERAYYKGRILQTLNFSGHGRPLSCKIYNKTLEIKQHSPEKAWFHDIWKRNGWDGKATIWRDEFSIERAGLREMDLEDIYETIRNIKRLWAYCTQEWLRMVIPGKTKNRTRWATAPIWEQIQAAFDDYGHESVDGLGPLIRKRKQEVNIDRGVAAIAGYATTLAAWCEHELDENDDADMIFSVIYDKVIARWQKLQIVPQDVVKEKKFIYSQKP